MRILALDPGAERMGWASIGKTQSVPIELPYYHLSGVLALTRGEKDFQDYRLALEEEVTHSTAALIELTQPNLMVSETLPSVLLNSQTYLANVAVSCAHSVAFSLGVPVRQIAARTVHSTIALRPKKKTKGVTKAQVRNGVLAILKPTEVEEQEIRQAWDASDACAIGLAALGFNVKNFV
jgi:Holliday junction resolvasome RuvABC endonuclease subunit